MQPGDRQEYPKEQFAMFYGNYVFFKGGSQNRGRAAQQIIS